MNLGAVQLATARTRLGWTNRKIAQLSGISEPEISRYMRGHRKPGRTKAAMLARLFDVPVDAWDQPADGAA